MALRIEVANTEQAHLVRQTMREACTVYSGVPNPPSGALSETVADVRQAKRDPAARLHYPYKRKRPHEGAFCIGAIMA